jgi:hypothetical protein
MKKHVFFAKQQDIVINADLAIRHSGFRQWAIESGSVWKWGGIRKGNWWSTIKFLGYEIVGLSITSTIFWNGSKDYV